MEMEMGMIDIMEIMISCFVRLERGEEGPGWCWCWSWFMQIADYLHSYAVAVLAVVSGRGYKVGGRMDA